MGAGPGRGSGGRKPQSAMGLLPNATLAKVAYRCHERKQVYDTMAAAEIDMPPSQRPYRCPYGDHWHRVTVRP